MGRITWGVNAAKAEADRWSLSPAPTMTRLVVGDGVGLVWHVSKLRCRLHCTIMNNWLELKSAGVIHALKLIT